MDRGLAAAGAGTLAEAYDAYRDAFARITARAPGRFARRDWAGMQRDARERLDLYSQTLTPTVETLAHQLRGRLRDKALWSEMKGAFSERIAARGDVELNQTFFSSASRRVFTTVGVDPAVEFVAPDAASLLRAPGQAVHRSVPLEGDSAAALRRILTGALPETCFEDLERDARLAAAEVEQRLGTPLTAADVEDVQVIVPPFFRNKAAYVVGRILRARDLVPLVLALTNPEGRVVLDAVLLETDEVSQIFSFTRSYFHVDVAQPYETIRFLKSLLPAKPVAELYIAIGYNKHGKTELYRELLRHLAESDEPFVVAPGDVGMVMLVFTLPSYDVVFKVIRDVFGPSKQMSRQQVTDNYRLVYHHDRAGRLIDAQEYEHLEFGRERFSPRLLASLLEGASSSITLSGDRVAIRHLYSERKITPLNLFLAHAPASEAEAATLGFGQAIKDLAASNVFPGDLLPKNFGVTRHGRVVFYDYDELSPLSDCHFRELPASAHEPESGDEVPFFVGPHDIFPEELERFLGLRGRLRELFLDAHGDLLKPRFWTDMQQRIAAGDFPDFYPYPASRRLPLRPG